MSIDPGTILLNKYRVDQMLGAGGFGNVYQATEIRLGRLVAIKELRTELAQSKEILDRFLNEARAIAALNNPHIVNVLSFDSEDTHNYLILEFMEGGSLGKLLSNRKRISPGEAALIAQSVCDGLASVHRMGIVHRDIKPANILLAKDGAVVKISDFGSAHVPSTMSGAVSLTQTGTTLGTVMYMSPEQARGEKADTRSDLYSVGATLYEMVAGQRYLEFTSDIFADLEKIKINTPRPMPQEVPVTLQEIILKSLAKNSADRYQSAAEFSAALAAFFEPGLTVAIPVERELRLPARLAFIPARLASLPRAALIAGAVAILALAFILFSIATQQPSASAPRGGTQTRLVEIVTPTTGRILNALEIGATQTHSAQSAQSTEIAFSEHFAATLTAAAPTITLTPRPSQTPLPSLTPSPTPTRALISIRLIGPANGDVFKVETEAPFLEWRPATTGPLADNEYYRVQVFHQPNDLQCNLYTKGTDYQLPASGKEPCNPNTWRFNTGDYIWRISFVVHVDNDRTHDKELVNSEGRLFKWNK